MSNNTVQPHGSTELIPLIPNKILLNFAFQFVHFVWSDSRDSRMQYNITPSLSVVDVVFDSLVELLPLVLQGQLPVDHDVDLPGGHRHTFTTSRDSA